MRQRPSLDYFLFGVVITTAVWALLSLGGWYLWVGNQLALHEQRLNALAPTREAADQLKYHAARGEAAARYIETLNAGGGK